MDYKIYNERGEVETSFIGFATLYGKKELVGIFNSWAFCLNAMIIKNGVPVVTDWSISGTVMYGNIQEMNDSLIFGGESRPYITMTVTQKILRLERRNSNLALKKRSRFLTSLFFYKLFGLSQYIK